VSLELDQQTGSRYQVSTNLPNDYRILTPPNT